MIETGIKLRRYKSIAFKAIVILLSIVCTIPLFVITFYIIKMGLQALNLSFLINVTKPVGESGGGILNSIIGTMLIITMATLIAVPVGVIGGMGLSEFNGSRFNYWGRLCTEILQGIPSIVIGIIAYLWIVKPLGKFSAFSGSIALAMMMLPLIIRTTEETINMIPNSLKEASLALGVPYYKTVLKIVLPASLSGIITGIILSISRTIGETAPLLFTAFGNPHLEFNILKPVNTIPLLIFNYAGSPYEEWHQQAWGASLVLLIWVIIINIVSKLLAMKWKVKY